jgi:protoheme IX farnesyltransferase
MAELTTAISPATGTARLRAYYELTKPGIAGYVMITAGVSTFVGAHGQPELVLAILTMVGTGMATAGALALNQYIERDVDARMVRTRDRPIPSGRLEAVECLTFGTALLVAGLTWLLLLVHWLPAALAALSAAAYHLVYTPLKSRTHLATLAGGVPGALPMLIGWTAATHAVDRGGLAMFAIGYAWQLPHVLGLAWMLREDYARVGFKLIPEDDADGRIIGRHMVFWMCSLIALSMVPTYLGLTGTVYLAGAILVSVTYLILGMGAARDLTEQAARKVFFGSLIYHPLILVLMLVDTVPR